MRTFALSGSFIALVAAAAVAVLVSGPGDARAMESFQLGEHDHLLAESARCQVECRGAGRQRTCTIRDLDCKVVCMDVPECRTPGRIDPLPRVCAVVRTR